MEVEREVILCEKVPEWLPFIWYYHTITESMTLSEPL